jgi:hypothetical protein
MHKFKDFIMKYAFITLTFAFFALGNCLFGQEEYDNLDKKVNAGYKECKIFIYTTNIDNKDNLNKHLDRIIRFDEFGNNIETTNFNNDNIIISKIFYNYNNLNKVIKSISYTYNDLNDSVILIRTYFYKKKGNLSEIYLRINNDSNRLESDFKYDSNNNLVKQNY